jgi:RNA-directed DNA polymerase
VYCRDANRTLNHEHIQFNFLSYTFKPRSAQNRWGRLFCECVDRRLARWARGKYKRSAAHPRQAMNWLLRVREQSRKLFAHWQLLIKPKGNGMIGAG